MKLSKLKQISELENENKKKNLLLLLLFINQRTIWTPEPNNNDQIIFMVYCQKIKIVNLEGKATNFRIPK